MFLGPEKTPGRRDRENLGKTVGKRPGRYLPAKGVKANDPAGICRPRV